MTIDISGFELFLISLVISYCVIKTTRIITGNWDHQAQ